ncbi:MAG: hydrogenase formation protein HypD, partial [Chlorobi bacterium]|nr:hydrogenase formation protein HypD [Chlorobiota bacterium]
MKYLDEFRDAKLARYYIDQINKIATQNWVIMEICGGQTHSIIQHGIDQVLPSNIEMVHGPGCPVCVTPLETLDRAIKIAKKDNVIFTSFGDMLRVPGSNSDLLKAKSEGADVR